MRSTVPSTRTKSPQRKLQEGQAIVLIALLILVLFAMLGLSIDSGRAYVDRRDQQAAVDAAALAAGDWYENFADLTGSTVPQSVALYQNDLRLYSGPLGAPVHTFQNVGVNNDLPQGIAGSRAVGSGRRCQVTGVGQSGGRHDGTSQDVAHVARWRVGDEARARVVAVVLRIAAGGSGGPVAVARLMEVVVDAGGAVGIDVSQHGELG